MRVGIIGLLHESNTFVHGQTDLSHFAQQSLFRREDIRRHLSGTHHEVAGFFAGLREFAREEETVEDVPLFFARALPSGTIDRETWRQLIEQMFSEIERAGQLDGLLVAPHGATVSEDYPDADGYWLAKLRDHVGPGVPIIGTLDPHANLSRQMVDACDALIAYRTNPHLDQRERGLEAARLMISTLRGEVLPVMRAEFPPLAISIDKQMTSEGPLRPLCELADRQLHRDLSLPAGAVVGDAESEAASTRLLSNSIVLGFPYADVAEMGSSVIAVADGDADLAARSARELAEALWSRRQEFAGEFLSVEQALEQALKSPGPVCLLDMGDNVGGGSAADGTTLVHALHQRRVPDSFACLFDPQAVIQAGPCVGKCIGLTVGGKTDDLHGPPFTAEFTVRSMHEGRFSEPRPRHGGMAEFDQGRTAIVETDHGLTLMLTSRRMVPFSLQQLVGCGLDPGRYRFLVAKGVNAPIAAYREVCRTFIRVNTPGSTCADMTQLTYHRRRRPLFPFETADLDASPTNPRRSTEAVQSSSLFPERGALLGIDFGTKRVGVALSTPDRSMASPLETYTRRNEPLDAGHFRELVADYRVVGLVVGLPVHVAGHESQKSREARTYGAWLAEVTGLPVTFWDERYTSAVAEEAMIAIDMTRRQRKGRLDKVAAQIMLQSFLNSRRVQRGSEDGMAP